MHSSLMSGFSLCPFQCLWLRASILLIIPMRWGRVLWSWSFSWKSRWWCSWELCEGTPSAHLWAPWLGYVTPERHRNDQQPKPGLWALSGICGLKSCYRGSERFRTWDSDREIYAKACPGVCIQEVLTYSPLGEGPSSSSSPVSASAGKMGV